MRHGSAKSSLEHSFTQILQPFFSSSSFYTLYVGGGKEGRLLFPRGGDGVPSAGRAGGWGSLDGLICHQLPVLECQSIDFFIKHETQTKISMGKGAW